MKRLSPYLFGGVLIAVLIAWARSPDDVYVAEVNDDGITADAYRSEYIDYLSSTGLPDTPTRRAAFLDRLIGMKLVVADARTSGLTNEPLVAASIRRAEEKLRLDYYVQRTALDSIEIREGEMREMFLRMNTQASASHLYAPTREKADALKRRLDAGESFDALAREVFQDPALAENGGSVGWFGFDQMDPVFEDVAFTLPVGAISEPVQTSLGYSIIRVDDRQPKPLITESEYAAAKERIGRYVLHRRQSAARRALVEGLVADLRVEYHANGVDKLMDIVQGVVELQGESQSSDLLSDILAEPLVSYDYGDARQTWTIGDFREKAQDTSPEQRAAVTSQEYLRQFISGLLARERMLRVFEESGWDRDAEFQRVSRAALDEVVYGFAYDDIVRSLADSMESREHIRDRVAALRSEASVTVHADLLAAIEL